MPSFEGTPSPSDTKLPHKILETLGYHIDPESLSDLGLVYHRVVTDGQTDGQAEFP